MRNMLITKADKVPKVNNVSMLNILNYSLKNFTFVV